MAQSNQAIGKSQSTSVSGRLVPLPLLQDPDSYISGTFILGRRYKSGTGIVSFAEWIEVFRRSIIDFQKRAVTDNSVINAMQKAEEFGEAYEKVLSEILSRHDSQKSTQQGQADGMDAVKLSRLREQCLRAAGFRDVFAAVKKEESEKSLQLLPAVLRDLDGIRGQPVQTHTGSTTPATLHSHEEALWTELLRGVFAGNIFDLGATASAKLFDEAGLSFVGTRKSLVERRCAIDNFAAAVQRLCCHTYSKALIFVDNAGSDVVLGMLPLARELLRKGTSVILAANSVPSINDVTAEELQSIVEQAGRLDQIISRSLLEGTLTVVGSGNDLPVIELNKISQELATAAEGVDLVILEGMGRGIETNLDAVLTVDKLNLGMIKHPEVATLLDCDVYNCVCKFTPAGTKP